MPGQTVTIASKLPFPLVLEVADNSGNVRKVTIRGNAVRPGQFKNYIAGGVEKTARVAGGQQMFIDGGAALTPNVDEDFWNKWRMNFKDATYVAKGMVFAAGTHDRATKMAEEHREIVTGLEGIDPEKPAKNITPLSRD